MSNLENILEKILKLSRLGVKEREEALSIVNHALKEFPESKDLCMRKAFLISHLGLDANYKKSIKEKELMINEAIKIYENYLDDENEKISSNANMYLTQLMSISGNKRALKLAEDNYKKWPNTVSANRLYGVCLDLKLFDKAKEYFKLYLKHEKEENGPKIFLLSNSYFFYMDIGEIEKAEKYKEEALDQNLEDEDQIACQNFLRKYKKR